MTTGDVLLTIEGRVGRIRLNRPKALHALTHDMCLAMIEALIAWRENPAVEAVLIDHAEGRGFCAGGDVRAVATAIAAGQGDSARRFFFDEYRLNHLLFAYAKPVAAVMDGVVMGGGVGIALPARYRIATERSLFAMPEATIGLFPDVGGGWYLSRLPGRIGQYLALTAARLDGAEMKALGLATHYVPAETIDWVKARVLEAPDTIQAILGTAAVVGPDVAILGQQEEIDRLFASDHLEDIIAATAASAWAPILATKSPQSMKVALALLARSAHFTDFVDEMRMEYAIVTRILQRPDFAEGVRALLIDKDNAPRWQPATADGVTDHVLDTIFAPLAGDEVWQPIRL